MFSLDPEIVAQALGDARFATWEWNPSSDELRWTSGQIEIYSRPSNEINSTQAWESIVHPEDRDRVRRAAEHALATETGFREQFRVQGKQGDFLWIFGYAKVARLEDQSLRMTGINIDVTDWAKALAAAEDRFTATFEQAAVGIAHVGLNGEWLNVNRRCCEIVGYSKEELKALTFSDITHPDDLDADWAQVRALLAKERTTYSMEKRYFTRDKQLVWVNLTVSLVLKADGSPDYFISVIEDITARKQLEAERDSLIQELESRVSERTVELEHLLMTDALTGIANRRRLDEYIASEWDRAVRARQPISVIIIDIDHFKGLNDGLGHGAADRALKVIASELTRALQRAGDLPARYGGDEFVVVLPNTNPEGAFKVANDVQAVIAKLAIAHPGSPIDTRITTSLGVATSWPLKKGSANGLLLAADRALYNAKRAGRNRIAVAGSKN
jgi:diguanylate cyclase (GGDEF)-like protein/PAS domain S-box-containing protein